MHVRHTNHALLWRRGQVVNLVEAKINLPADGQSREQLQYLIAVRLVLEERVPRSVNYNPRLVVDRLRAMEMAAQAQGKGLMAAACRELRERWQQDWGIQL